MKLTEQALRTLTRRVLKELFTRKDRISFRGMTDYDIDPHDYSGEGEWGGDDGLGESDELEEEEEALDER